MYQITEHYIEQAVNSILGVKNERRSENRNKVSEKRVSFSVAASKGSKETVQTNAKTI